MFCLIHYWKSYKKSFFLQSSLIYAAGTYRDQLYSSQQLLISIYYSTKCSLRFELPLKTSSPFFSKLENRTWTILEVEGPINTSFQPKHDHLLTSSITRLI